MKTREQYIQMCMDPNRKECIQIPIELTAAEVKRIYSSLSQSEKPAEAKRRSYKD